jgi:DNA polymerase-3 subunit delta'
MLPVLYGKQSLQATLSQMMRGGRLAQGFLFYGDAGLGRKTLAHWFAALLLCEHPEDGKPCGHCKSCHNMQSDCHPDFLPVEHSGKLGGFSVETVRQVCNSVVVPPNNGSRKVYLFADCDTMDVRSQNILLKVLEEPPAYAYFLFTASANDILLSTIRSRILSFGLQPCPDADCQAALVALGQPETAAERFPGNIGQSLAYATDPTVQAAVQRVEQAVQALQQRNAYAFLQTIAQIGKDRQQARFFLQQLKRYVRDVMVLHSAPTASCCSCVPQLAEQVARQTAHRQGEQQYEAICRAEQALQANGNVQLLLAALCGELLQA